MVSKKNRKNLLTPLLAVGLMYPIWKKCIVFLVITNMIDDCIVSKKKYNHRKDLGDNIKILIVATFIN